MRLRTIPRPQPRRLINRANRHRTSARLSIDCLGADRLGCRKPWRLQQFYCSFPHLKGVVVGVCRHGSGTGYRDPSACRAAREALRNGNARRGQHASQCSAGKVPNDDPLTGTHRRVACELACRVAKQAIHHVRAGQLQILSVETRDICHKLCLNPSACRTCREEARARRRGRRRASRLCGPGHARRPQVKVRRSRAIPAPPKRGLPGRLRPY